MSSSYQQLFKFKQFDIYQDHAAMKVGTDGVLLGAWSNIKNPQKILDIGTGTGLIALMLAQRFSNAQIHAIEINKEATIQAQYNFSISPWNNRLKLYQTDFLKFTNNLSYDLIVCNPPFFNKQTLSNNEARNIARHTLKLNLEELITKSARLLKKVGSIQLILPINHKKKLEKICLNNNLYINKITYIKGNKKSSAKRMLVAISFFISPLQTDVLIIEKQRHIYTDEYIKLTKDFYLKM